MKLINTAPSFTPLLCHIKGSGENHYQLCVPQPRKKRESKRARNRTHLPGFEFWWQNDFQFPCLQQRSVRHANPPTARPSSSSPPFEDVPEGAPTEHHLHDHLNFYPQQRPIQGYVSIKSGCSDLETGVDWWCDYSAPYPVFSASGPFSEDLKLEEFLARLPSPLKF